MAGHRQHEAQSVDDPCKVLHGLAVVLTQPQVAHDGTHEAANVSREVLARSDAVLDAPLRDPRTLVRRPRTPRPTHAAPTERGDDLTGLVLGELGARLDLSAHGVGGEGEAVGAVVDAASRKVACIFLASEDWGSSMTGSGSSWTCSTVTCWDRAAPRPPEGVDSGREVPSNISSLL